MRFTVALAAFAVAALFSLTSLPPRAHAVTTGCLPPSLKSTLAKMRRKFGPIKIISSYRPGAVIAGSGRPSYHASCRAVDFHPPKGKYRAVVAWLKKHHRGGVGTYSCGMHHIHIDAGPKVKWHKCQGGGTRYARRKTKRRRNRAAAQKYYYGYSYVPAGYGYYYYYY